MRSAFLIAVFVAAAPAAGQQPPDPTRPSHVPIEFLELLAAGPMGGAAELMVGRIPDELFDLLRPGPSSRIVGTMKYPMYSTSALVMPGHPPATATPLRARLRDAGWRPLPTRRREATGFEAPAMEVETGDGQLCAPDGSSSLTMASLPYHGDSTAVIVVSVDGMMSNVCRRDDDRMMQLPPQAPMPVLRAPEGAAMAGAGTSGGSEERSSWGRVRTPLSAAELAAHYANEMARAGWSQTPPSIGSHVVAQLFALPVENGPPWQGVLTVIPDEAGMKHVHLRIMQER